MLKPPLHLDRLLEKLLDNLPDFRPLATFHSLLAPSFSDILAGLCRALPLEATTLLKYLYQSHLCTLTATDIFSYLQELASYLEYRLS